MAATASLSPIGRLLRDWRHRRRMTQLDLALEANVSARHISFVETGRAKPSRELVIQLAEELDIPLRERNHLLLAAGFAPIYDETALEDGSMVAVRHALKKILDGHEPFPAVVIDRHWTLVWSNDPARQILAQGVAEHLLIPQVNAMRVTLHPEGLAPRIANLEEWSAHLLSRLDRQLARAPDPALEELRQELASYPGVSAGGSALTELSELLFVPMHLRLPRGAEYSLFSTIATFGTALDITLAELAIDCFFPADKETAAALRRDFG